MKPYHERNTAFLEDKSANIYFENLLNLTESQFDDWVCYVTKKLIDNWDVNGIPPVVGYDEKDMIEQFNRMSGFDPESLWDVDQLTGERNVIRNKTKYGICVNQFFPYMFKTPISNSLRRPADSIYDFYSDPANFKKIRRAFNRNFRHDSFYHYSTTIKRDDIKGVDWMAEFDYHSDEYSFWLNPIKYREKGYSGYRDYLHGVKVLTVTKDELMGCHVSSGPHGYMLRFPPFQNLFDSEDWQYDKFEIRLYKKRQRLFPVGIKVFRMAYAKQIAVNFPPLIAKALYERYTEHIPESQPVITIYDPSAGWGSRILAAMAYKDSRAIHYVGTDPNGANHGRYEAVAEFFNSRTTRANPFFSHTNTYDIFNLGSEEIANEPRFQQYRGCVDLVFTSPPYFAKEIYSDEPTQSCIRFPTYEAWREGFLRPTLRTAVEWLRKDRYLLWNVADPEFDHIRLPLEDDSRRILEELGMEFVGVVKMALAMMPGANRLQEADDYDVEVENTLDGVVETKKKKFLTFTKNSCKVNGRMVKYEPIFIFRKPA